MNYAVLLILFVIVFIVLYFTYYYFSSQDNQNETFLEKLIERQFSPSRDETQFTVDNWFPVTVDKEYVTDTMVEDEQYVSIKFIPKMSDIENPVAIGGDYYTQTFRENTLKIKTSSTSVGKYTVDEDETEYSSGFYLVTIETRDQ